MGSDGEIPQNPNPTPKPEPKTTTMSPDKLKDFLRQPPKIGIEPIPNPGGPPQGEPKTVPFNSASLNDLLKVKAGVQPIPNPGEPLKEPPRSMNPEEVRDLLNQKPESRIKPLPNPGAPPENPKPLDPDSLNDFFHPKSPIPNQEGVMPNLTPKATDTEGNSQFSIPNEGGDKIDPGFTKQLNPNAQPKSDSLNTQASDLEPQKVIPPSQNAEAVLSQNPEKFYNAVPVAVSENRLGLEITNKGDSLNLGDIFGGESQIDAVYVRTENDIYAIQKDGSSYQIVDGRASAVPGKGAVMMSGLPLESLQELKVTVGEPIDIFEGTTPVAEILMLKKQIINDPEALTKETNGRINPIIKDFADLVTKGMKEPLKFSRPKEKHEIVPVEDLFSGAQEALRTNKPELFKAYLQEYLRTHPGGASAEEMFAMAANGGEMSDRTKQAIQWSQEARALAMFGPKGEEIYRALRDAVKKENKELFDKIRTQQMPDIEMGKIAKMLERDLQLANNGKDFLNMLKFNGLHDTK